MAQVGVVFRTSWAIFARGSSKRWRVWVAGFEKYPNQRPGQKLEIRGILKMFGRNKKK
jgi:hypothetical protein